MPNNTKEETIAIIRQKVAGCFGSADGIFAGHQLDENRAKEVRSLAFKNKITLKEIEELYQNYMNEKGFNAEHQKEQMKKIHKYFGKKLL